jgi:hypothetical protein
VLVGGVGGCANGFLETASVADLRADFSSLRGEQGGDGDGGFRRGGGGDGSVGAKGGGGGGGGGACATTTRALSDLDLKERRPDSPALEKAGGEAGAGDDGYDGVLSVDATGDAALERSAAAWTAAARVLCEADDAPFDEPRGE